MLMPMKKLELSVAATALCALTGLVALPLVGVAPASAATALTVETVDALQQAFTDATGSTTLVLGESFPEELPQTINLSNAAGAEISVDGGGHRLTSPPSGKHIILGASGTAVLSLSDLTLAPAADRTNGGLSVSLNDTATVDLSALSISGLTQAALDVGGSGTGDFTADNIAITDNRGSSAAGISFNRNNATATSTMRSFTVADNVSTGGYGYSGGAMRIGAGARGNLTVADSVFLDNALRDGGSLPRGGAIAMHNASVLLTLQNDYFEGNSVDSGTAPGSADGGAVSVFNSTANTTGSLLVENSSFVANEAADDGAAIFIEGQNATGTAPFVSTLTIRNSTFASNVSGDAAGSDSGGAIQTSLRVQVDIDANTFFGNTKANGRSGVDFGAHTTFNSGGFQRPIGTLTNNIFTRSNSVATLSCTGNLGCGVATAGEDALILGVFGTEAPVPSAHNTLRTEAGASGSATRYVPTLAIAPPLTDTTPTASRFVTAPTSLTSDQRNVPYRTEGAQDSGSFTMDYVRFDARTNGGSWSGLTPTVPAATGSFLSDPTASHDWFELNRPGGAVALPSVDPTGAGGSVFLGWFDQPSGGSTVSSATALGQTVYAQFAIPAPTFVVTFEPGNGEASFTEDVTEGDPVGAPAVPTREGYEFTGWTLEGEAYDFATAVTGNITLTGTWEEVAAAVYVVTFEPGNGEASFTEDVTEGDPVGVPALPTREGYQFTGWTLEGEAYDFATAVTGNITLTGTWERVSTSPTGEPTAPPTTQPTAPPTTEPTASPTAAPTTAPTAAPSTTPTTPPTEGSDSPGLSETGSGFMIPGLTVAGVLLILGSAFAVRRRKSHADQ